MHTLLMTVAIFIATQAPPAGVHGSVLDADGQPVQGAFVVLVRGYQSDGLESAPTTTSRADGRFSFPDWREDGGRWSVLAYKEGFALSGAAVYAPLQAFEDTPQTVIVRLGRPAKSRFRLLDPEGKVPDPKTALALTQFSLIRSLGNSQRIASFSAPVPPALAKMLALRMENDGSVELNFLAPASAYGVEITAPGLGTQRALYLPADNKDPQQVKLGRIGKLSGQIVTAEPAAAAGLKITVTTTEKAPPTVPGKLADMQTRRAVGHAATITDAAGQFEISEISAGDAFVTVDVRTKLGWLPPKVNTTVKPAENTNLTITLERGVRVHGRIIGHGSSIGISGVALYVGEERVISGAQGEFEAFVRPGRFNVSVTSVPLPWLPPFDRYRGDEVKPGVKEHELAAMTLKRGLPLEGVVVDEADKPVAGAHVTAVWRKTDGQYSTLGSDNATSDADGRFVLARVSGDVSLGLSAATTERATLHMKEVLPGPRQMVKLTVRSEGMVIFEGRVLDNSGKPVAGARPQFVRATRLPTGENYGHRQVNFGDTPLTTDADGVFRTSTKVMRSEEYALQVEAAGMVKYESKSTVPPREGDKFRWPDVILRRQTNVAGIVVNSEGKPVEGASVWSHGVELRKKLTARTDAEGRFQLAELHPDARLVFVSKEGHRATGGTIAKKGELRLTIEAAGSPSGARLATVVRPPEVRKRLLKDLLDPMLAILDPDREYFVAQAIKRLAPFDKEFAVRQLEGLKNPAHRADSLAALNFVDDALEAAALVKSPYSRSWQFLHIADAIDDKARKCAVLAEAVVQARTIEQPDERVVVLTRIAERFLKMHDEAVARKIFDECKPVAEKLAPTEWSGFARGQFATAIAAFDPDGAINLVKDMKDEAGGGDGLTRHAGNIAYKLAGTHPAKAELALKMIKRDLYVTPYAVKICYPMAPIDLPRARRIAEGLATDERGRGSNAQAHAYGLMALALVRKDPAAAKELLGQAFDIVAKSQASDRNAWPLAVALLSYSETVDPERTREYFWRALSLHMGPVAESWSPDERVERTHDNNCQLALLLALYGQFPELQSELLEPVLRHWSKYTKRKEFNFYRQNSIFIAMALAAPERGVAWHAEFYPKVDKEDRRLIPQPWMMIADALSLEGHELRQLIIEQVFHLWGAGKEDD